MPRRIYLSRDKKIGGVCAGIAEYLNIDPTVVRLTWLVLALVYGTGILAYLICWIVIPNTPH